MALSFTVLLHLILATVDIRATVSVPGWAFDASVWIVDLFLVFGKVGRVVKRLRTMGANVFLGFEVNAVHVAIQSVLDCKGTSTTRPGANKVLRASVSRQVLVKLIFGNERLRAAWTGERLVACVTMHVSDQLISGRKAPFVTARPVAHEAASPTDVVRPDVVIQ